MCVWRRRRHLVSIEDRRRGEASASEDELVMPPPRFNPFFLFLRTPWMGAEEAEGAGTRWRRKRRPRTSGAEISRKKRK